MGRRKKVMAKSTNHTAHNQAYKNHRNGIKKPKKERYLSLKGWTRSSSATSASLRRVRVLRPMLPRASKQQRGDLSGTRVIREYVLATKSRPPVVEGRFL